MAGEVEKLDQLVARQEAVAATLQQAAQTLANIPALAPMRDGGAGVSWTQLLVGCAVTGILAGVGAFFVNWGLMREHMATITERVDGHTQRLAEHDRHFDKLDSLIAGDRGRGR